METEGGAKVEHAEPEGGATSGHTCRVCGRSFPLLSSLSQHMRRHTREKPYKCPYCEHRAAQKGSLKSHMRSHKLGLVLKNLGDEDGAGGDARGEAGAEKGDQEKQEDSDRPDAAAPLTNGTVAKKHKVNGRTKKKACKKKSREAVREEPQGRGEAAGEAVEAERPDSGGEAEAQVENGAEAETEEDTGAEAGAEAGTELEAEAGAEAEAEAGPFPCASCGQLFPQASLLKSHMKKHRSSQDHGCRICGRRFRQAWFLQSHMRIHRAKTAPRASEGGQPPVTINGAPQDQASLANDECLYELCAGCGNFFHDRKSLRIHEKVHKQSQASQPSPPQPQAPETLAAKAHFLGCLNLRAVGSSLEEGGLGGRIPQLDPVCSYQAWQLATRGRVVEVAERGAAWGERLAEGEGAYDKDRGQYGPVKADRKRRQLDVSPASKKKKGGSGGEGAGGGRGGAMNRGGRALLTGLTPEAFLALQKKRVREGHTFTKLTSLGADPVQRDKKPYMCEYCDFSTRDASTLSSHLLRQHKDLIHRGPEQDQPSGVKGYMGYLQLRETLLSQPFWSPFTSSSPQQARPAIGQLRTPGRTEGRGRGDAAVDAGLLNLSLPAEALEVEGPEEDAGKVAETEGRLVRHRCPYCIHTTHYPEVLWIHQRVAHKVDGASSLAPKWAPHVNGVKGAKPGRRTGPPPFLEGKDCPALPPARTQRTQPPGDPAPAASSKKPAPKTPKTSNAPSPQSKPRTQPASSRSAVEKAPPSVLRKTLLPQKKSSARPGHSGAGSGNSRSSGDARPKVTSSAASGDGPGFSFHPGSSLSYGGLRASSEASLLPQEGLGFILARNQAHTEHAPHPTPDRTHHHSQSQDTSAGPKSHDLWSVMNMFGTHGSGGYLAPGAPPMEVDIMSLLKNYNPHDLAALYQHWGYVDPRFEAQAMLQANGHGGNEIHSSDTKQVSGRSSMSAPSLRKAT